MKIAYITGDIKYNANFAFYHDLLANFPIPEGQYHRLYLVNHFYDLDLINTLKSKGIDVRSCFRSFHLTLDNYWETMKRDLEDVDVILSGHITNLDEAVPEIVKKPIVSISFAEQGYSSNNNPGSFYKERFHLIAISKTAVNAFPKHARTRVKVVKSGIDATRMELNVERDQGTRMWFGEGFDKKIMLVVGPGRSERGLMKTIESLRHLPDWYLMIVTNELDVKIPAELRKQVYTCSPLYRLSEVYNACDCLVLPTQHEGFSTTLLEAWYTETPVVTTNHNSMTEIIEENPNTYFGEILDCRNSLGSPDPKTIAEAVERAQFPKQAAEVVRRKYLAPNMIDDWQKYLEGVCGEKVQ